MLNYFLYVDEQSDHASIPSLLKPQTNSYFHIIKLSLKYITYPFFPFYAA